MKIAIVGAGAIGGLAAGYLKLKGLDVFLVGRPDSVNAIKENGLQISGARGNFNIKIDTAQRLTFKPDLIIFATKTQDVEIAVKDNLKFIKDTIVLTAQNGVQADNILSKYIPKENIISSIVMFGATNLEPAEIVHNFQGDWIIGKINPPNDEKVEKAGGILSEAFSVVIAEDIKGMKYLKIFVNANNCIPALLGISMQEAFSDLDLSRISIAIWKEGLEIISQAKIKLQSLPDFPLERLTKMAGLPGQEAAKIFSGIMVNLSKEPLYGSILQSIKRGKTSEIDYINGEFVNIARKNNLRAPLNEKLAEMVHIVENRHKFFSKDELLSETRNFVHG